MKMRHFIITRNNHKMLLLCRRPQEVSRFMPILRENSKKVKNGNPRCYPNAGMVVFTIGPSSWFLIQNRPDNFQDMPDIVRFLYKTFYACSKSSLSGNVD